MLSGPDLTGPDLTDLERIDWDALTHAYGAAGDVPGLLRDLADPARFEGALSALYGNVFHQGTRYPATPHVVPFGIALVEAGVQPAALTTWLTHLVAGYRNPISSGLWCDGDRIHEWSGRSAPITDPDADLGYGTTPTILAATWHAAAEATPLWRRLLSDPDPLVRTAAAGMLSVLVRREGVVEALQARLEAEPEGGVRGALVVALREVAPEVAEARLSDPALVCRFLAAVCRPDLEASAPVLIAGLGGVEGYPEGVEQAAAALHSAPRSVQVAAIPALCAALGQHADFTLVPIVRTLLAAAFPEPRRENPTELQEQVLRALVAAPYLWRIGNLADDLRAHNIPGRAKLADLLDLPLPDDRGLQSIDSGLTYARMGFADKAVAHFDGVPWPTLFDQHPDGFDALVHYAQLLTATAGREADAAQLWGEIATRADQPVQALINRAVLLSRAEGAAAEVAALRDVTDAFPDAAEAWHALGIALRHTERFTDALAATDKALALAPDHRDAWWNRGSVLCLLGRLEAAVEAVLRCLSIDPSVAPLLAADADFDAIRADPRFVTATTCS